MSKTIRILAILAVVQVVIAGVLFLGGNSLSNSTPRSTLFDFENAKVDKLLIKSNDETVELVKAEGDKGEWKTADDFPVNQSKVTGLLNKLQELKTSFPVATSSSAFERFKLADDDFERHITLEADGKSLGSLYVGSGAGARRSHVRHGDDPAVYSVNIGTYDAPSDINEWLDKSVLQLKAEDLKTVSFGDSQFEKIDDVWKVDKLPDGKNLESKAIDDGLAPLLSLRFDKLLGKESKPEYGLDKPELSIKLTHKSGEREYSFAKLKGEDNGGNYVLKTSDRPEFFQVAGYSVKPLLEKIALDKWFSIAEPEKSEEPETTNDSPGADIKPQEKKPVSP